MRIRYGLGVLCVVVGLGAISSCGGGGGSTPTPVTLPPTPAVSITAVGEGALVLHPSANDDFFFALEAPIRITETTGGTADWNFARIQFFRNGKENERYELTANDIAAAGFKKILARSNKVLVPVFRNNDENFDTVRVTLGFADLKDGRQFTIENIAGWSDVTVSLTPLRVPADGTVRLGN